MLDTRTLKEVLKQDVSFHKSSKDFSQLYPYLFTDLTAPNEYEVEELGKFEVNIGTFQSVVSVIVHNAVDKSSAEIANIIAMNIRDLGADAFSDLVTMVDKVKERYYKQLRYEVLKQNQEAKVSHELNEETP